jgi:hypothetical protein
VRNEKSSKSEFNIVMNLIDDLEMTYIFIMRTDDKRLWRWVSTSLTRALYLTMLGALEAGNYFNVLNLDKPRRKAKKEIEKLNTEGKLTGSPEEIETYKYMIISKHEEEYVDSGAARVIGFRKALELVQRTGPPMERFTFSKCLKLSKESKTNILKLRELFRNNFEHFKPTTWFIDNSIFPPLCQPTLDTIEWLLFSSGNFHANTDFEANREKIKSIICRIRIEIKNKEVKYGINAAGA